MIPPLYAKPQTSSYAGCTVTICCKGYCAETDYPAPERSSTTDRVIDLGSEGGNKGGEIVATGSPEQVAREKRSYTGRYLAPLLAGAKGERVAAE